jgi:hypothetical protein
MCRAVCAGEMTFPAASATGAGQAGDGAAAIRPFLSPGERDAADARRATGMPSAAARPPRGSPGQRASL